MPAIITEEMHLTPPPLPEELLGPPLHLWKTINLSNPSSSRARRRLSHSLNTCLFLTECFQNSQSEKKSRGEGEGSYGEGLFKCNSPVPILYDYQNISLVKSRKDDLNQRYVCKLSFCSWNFLSFLSWKDAIRQIWNNILIRYTEQTHLRTPLDLHQKNLLLPSPPFEKA